MEAKGYKIKFISLVIVIFFLSSCKTIETVHTEYVKDSTVELFLKEQLEIKELQLSEINRELKETYKEVTKLKAETNTSIEKYDTAQNVTERIIINRVESADNSKEYNSELFETLHTELTKLVEQNNELNELIDNLEQQVNNQKIKDKGFWDKLKNWTIGSLIILLILLIVYLNLTKLIRIK